MTGAHELFALDPKEFVAARDQLVRELKAAGDKEGAAAVKALKRPTVPLWALNQVARQEADAVDALMAAAADARAAQQAVLGGGAPDPLRDALTRRRESAAAVSRAARAVIEASGRSADAHERDVETAIAAATASAEVAAVFARGELSELGSPAQADDDMLAALMASGPAPSPRAPQPKQPSPQVEKARERVAAARDEAAAAAEELSVADKALQTAQRRYDDARRAAERADKALEKAEESLRKLHEQVP